MNTYKGKGKYFLSCPVKPVEMLKLQCTIRSLIAKMNEYIALYFYQFRLVMPPIMFSARCPNSHGRCGEESAPTQKPLKTNFSHSDIHGTHI